MIRGQIDRTRTHAHTMGFLHKTITLDQYLKMIHIQGKHKVHEYLDVSLDFHKNVRREQVAANHDICWRKQG